MRIYEGMFVVDDRRYNENSEAVTRQLRGILEKHQAEILDSEKWDERKLAYYIRGHNRGVYLLTRFTAPPSAIRDIERDCQLNDTILRVLLTRDEHSEKLHKAGLLKLGDEAAEEQPEGAPSEEPGPPAEASEQQPDAAPPAEQPAADESPGASSDQGHNGPEARE